jgi:hypothetical protein
MLPASDMSKVRGSLMRQRPIRFTVLLVVAVELV